jgi:hypothetical protein
MVMPQRRYYQLGSTAAEGEPESQESQDEFGPLELDFNDPELLIALGEINPL